jgi:cysteine desulfuration protein SufE
MIVRGLVSILMRVFSDAPPAEISMASTDFLKDAGFASHLSPNRTNGLYSMVEQIKLYAVALQALAKAKGLA